MKIRWTLIACLALLTSCGKEIPDDIIQPEVMEKVLYDYHLSLSMSSNGRNTEKEAQKNYIFQKYRINEALFDSSMVWYTRESKELMAIYENLDKRFKREHDHIERLLESRDESNTRTSISGDTVNIWRKGDIHWFTRTPLNRQLSFDIKADTTFHEKDAFQWDMDFHFFAEGPILMGLNVIYENDSVIGTTKLINASGPQSIYLHTDSAYQVRMLNGFIYVPDDTIASNPKVLVHNISLTRYHMPAPADSLSTDKQEPAESPKPETKPEEPKRKVRTPEKSKKELQKPQPADDKRNTRNTRMETLETIE